MSKYSFFPSRIGGSTVALDFFRRSAANLIGALAVSMAASPGVASEPAHYVDARNQYVTVDQVRLAYRSIGSRTDAPPLVLFQHFAGTMDEWDAQMVDALALRRRVIVLGNPGVGASGGPAPDSVADMSHLAEHFIDALQLKTVDVLGFSIGGSLGQQLVVDRPELVRKLILVGAGPKGGEGIKTFPAAVAEAIKRAKAEHVDPQEAAFFTTTQRGKAAAKAFMSRIRHNTVDVEKPATPDVIKAQAKALVGWGEAAPNFEELETIKQPVLVVNGSNDTLIPTVNSYTLYRHIPDATLVLYPDSGHGSLFQYHDRFVSEVDAFLDGDR